MGDNEEANKMNERLDQQRRQADELSASKLATLTRTRMDIQKGFDAPQWNNPEAASKTDTL